MKIKRMTKTDMGDQVNSSALSEVNSFGRDREITSETFCFKKDSAAANFLLDTALCCMNKQLRARLVTCFVPPPGNFGELPRFPRAVPDHSLAQGVEYSVVEADDLFKRSPSPYHASTLRDRRTNDVSRHSSLRLRFIQRRVFKIV